MFLRFFQPRAPQQELDKSQKITEFQYYFVLLAAKLSGKGEIGFCHVLTSDERVHYYKKISLALAKDPYAYIGPEGLQNAESFWNLKLQFNIEGFASSHSSLSRYKIIKLIAEKDCQFIQEALSKKSKPTATKNVHFTEYNCFYYNPELQYEAEEVAKQFDIILMKISQGFFDVDFVAPQTARCQQSVLRHVQSPRSVDSKTDEIQSPQAVTIHLPPHVTAMKFSNLLKKPSK